MNSEEVKIDELQPRSKNPRRGNLEAIKKSLKTNGLYKPIVVNRRNKEILAGNHTWQAARELGWQSISVWYVDVDEKQAQKIVLADNKTSDLAGYDDTILLDVLKDLDGDLEGTGFSIDDMEDIMSSVDGAIDTAYEEFGGDFAETAEETAERYEHRESVKTANEEKRQRVKEIVVAFPEDKFDDFIQDIFELKTRWEVGSTSEIVAEAIKRAVQNG